MPSKVIAFSVHNLLTKRDYSFSIDDFSDLALTTCIFVWMYTFYIWSGLDENESTGKEKFSRDAQSRYTLHILTVNTEEHQGGFEFEILPFLSIMVVFMWVRFLLMLQLTRTFGPMLRILLNMAGDVLKFLTIWAVFIIMITSVASLLFGELEAYSQFTEVIFLTFGTGIGSYDMSVFDNLSLGKEFGETFVCVAIIINNIILLNFVIAI